jgi:hypothetical protein
MHLALLPKTRDGAGADPIFVGGNDYHLDASDTWAQAQGADLDADASLAITNDIDGDARDPFAPDIGSDEQVSVATATPTSTSTASNTPTATWTPTNTGRQPRPRSRAGRLTTCSPPLT